jgi:hypothetical protein
MNQEFNAIVDRIALEGGPQTARVREYCPPLGRSLEPLPNYAQVDVLLDGHKSLLLCCQNRMAKPRTTLPASKAPPGSFSLDSLIAPILINSWRRFEQCVERHFPTTGRWMFRGHSDRRWILSTTLERVLDGIPRSSGPAPHPPGLHGDPAKGMRERLELYFVRAFQSRAGALTARPPDIDDTLGWLAMMQHWGFPTRLLDLTTSPYVALHFALAPRLRCDATPRRSAALYAIHGVALRRIASSSVGSDEIDFSQPQEFRKYFFRKERCYFVAPVHPSLISERMAAQQGTFVCPTTIYEPFEKCLTAPAVGRKCPIDDLVKKLILTPAAIQEIYPRLVRMNIHEASLYPDIHGYARFLSDNVQRIKRSKDRDWIVEFEGLERLKWPG